MCYFFDDHVSPEAELKKYVQVLWPGSLHQVKKWIKYKEYANSVASLPPTRGPQRQFRALKNPQRLILRKKASEPSAKPISVFSFTSRFPMRYHLAMEEFRKHFYHNMLCHWPCTQVSGATGGEGYSGKSLELFQCSPPCLPLTSEVK